jgi:hypothetical protein
MNEITGNEERGWAMARHRSGLPGVLAGGGVIFLAFGWVK